MKKIKRIDKVTSPELFIEFDELKGGRIPKADCVFVFWKDKDNVFRLQTTAKIDSQIMEGSRPKYSDFYFQRARAQMYKLSREFDKRKKWVQGKLDL